MKKGLSTFISVWGEKHLGWMERALIPSLSQPENKAALSDCTFSVVTKPEHQERITSILQKSGIKYRDIEFLMLPPEFDDNPHSAGSFLKHAFVTALNRAMIFNQRILIAPPDTIFGDRSVPNMLELADQRDVVVFAAHVRVLPDIIEDINLRMAGNRFGPSPLTNAQLVKMAFKRLHKTWGQAQFGAEQINSFIGGVQWRYLAEDLYSVQHRLPTPYVINPTPEDIQYFQTQLHFGVLDHAWPGELLIKTERQRYVGSSDCAFLVELTDPDANIPPTAPYLVDVPDLYLKNNLHNRVNRMTNVIFRGE